MKVTVTTFKTYIIKGKKSKANKKIFKSNKRHKAMIMGNEDSKKVSHSKRNLEIL